MHCVEYICAPSSDELYEATLVSEEDARKMLGQMRDVFDQLYWDLQFRFLPNADHNDLMRNQAFAGAVRTQIAFIDDVIARPRDLIPMDLRKRLAMWSKQFKGAIEKISPPSEPPTIPTTYGASSSTGAASSSGGAGTRSQPYSASNSRGQGETTPRGKGPLGRRPPRSRRA